MTKRRITFKLTLTRNTKLKQIEELCEKIRTFLNESPDIHKETILVYFTDLGESSLDVFLCFFTNTTEWKEYLDVKHIVNLYIMKLLEELNISLAYPSRSIYIENGEIEMREE